MSEDQQVSKAQFAEWLENPVTRAVMSNIKDMRDVHVDARNLMNAGPDMSLQQIGEVWLRHTIYIDAYTSILDIEFEEVPEEDKIDESDSSGISAFSAADTFGGED